jgi:branched-subunit amino acid aminotransferase/4-amino-4-deoxychorismate lyase
MTNRRQATFGPFGGAGSLITEEGPRTALPIRNALPAHFDAHLERLEAGAAALGIQVPWLTGAAVELLAWVRSQGHDEAALRLALMPREGALVATLEPLPRPFSPCPLVLLPHPMGDLRASFLARHKGLSGPWRSVALAEARQRGAVDALLHWPDGSLAETTLATVALELDGRLLLPPPEGRVASVTERLDLPGWAAERGLNIRIDPLKVETLANGRLWCLNALRGIWPAELL